MKCTQRLYLTANSKALVGEGDKKAATLYAVPGDEIPQSAADQFGLVDGHLKDFDLDAATEAKAKADAEAAEKEKAEQKAKAQREKEAAAAKDKEQKGASDKEHKSGSDKGSGAGQAAQSGDKA